MTTVPKFSVGCSHTILVHRSLIHPLCFSGPHPPYPQLGEPISFQLGEAWYIGILIREEMPKDHWLLGVTEEVEAAIQRMNQTKLAIESLKKVNTQS